jgi:hypothetical protein
VRWCRRSIGSASPAVSAKIVRERSLMLTRGIASGEGAVYRRPGLFF